jgi:hypothetical protein
MKKGSSLMTILNLTVTNNCCQHFAAVGVHPPYPQTTVATIIKPPSPGLLTSDQQD